MANECLTLVNANLAYRFPRAEIKKKENKKELLEIYKGRGNFEETVRKENAYVVGYEQLLPNLEHTTIKSIEVNSIMTESGTFIIFSDYDYNELIGVLKSKATLSETKTKIGNSPYYGDLILIEGTQ